MTLRPTGLRILSPRGAEGARRVALNDLLERANAQHDAQLASAVFMAGAAQAQANAFGGASSAFGNIRMNYISGMQQAMPLFGVSSARNYPRAVEQITPDPMREWEREFLADAETFRKGQETIARMNTRIAVWAVGGFGVLYLALMLLAMRGPS